MKIAIQIDLALLDLVIVSIHWMEFCISWLCGSENVITVERGEHVRRAGFQFGVTLFNSGNEASVNWWTREPSFFSWFKPSLHFDSPSPAILRFPPLVIPTPPNHSLPLLLSVTTNSATFTCENTSCRLSVSCQRPDGCFAPTAPQTWWWLYGALPFYDVISVCHHCQPKCANW